VLVEKQGRCSSGDAMARRARRQLIEGAFVVVIVAVVVWI